MTALKIVCKVLQAITKCKKSFSSIFDYNYISSWTISRLWLYLLLIDWILWDLLPICWILHKMCQWVLITLCALDIVLEKLFVKAGKLANDDYHDTIPTCWNYTKQSVKLIDFLKKSCKFFWRCLLLHLYSHIKIIYWICIIYLIQRWLN